ncbi:CoA transferase [Amycolatopsis sp. NPDC023774]|uniref:CaiB/BaiF CoA transferase family protein n=1 Tax=Amycolatopsis sp. NPDC023774 TaxID=3155015 RepID=UPI0033FC883B
MGPYATQIMGDLGADVVKVESPAGDSTRRTHPQRHDGMGALALNVNRNKRSVELDLKSAAGHDAFLRLVKTADVLVTNMHPGALRRLSLDYEQLAELNPRLVYCNAQGFRTDSDRAGLAAYDEIVQASSGMADLMRRATGTPTYAPTILADKLCALTIVYSVLAAVVHQRTTRRGQRVEVPMADTMLAFNLVEHLAGHTFGPAIGPMGFNRSMTEGHQAARTADGWACVLPYTEKNIADFFRAAGREDLATDPRFGDPASRAKHYGELYDEIGKLSVEKTTAEWQKICAELSIPFAPVLELEDVETDPYYTGSGLVSPAEHPTEGTYRQVGPPMILSDTPASVRRHTPARGEHTRELLAELGYAGEDIANLVSPVSE